MKSEEKRGKHWILGMWERRLEWLIMWNCSSLLISEGCIAMLEDEVLLPKFCQNFVSHCTLIRLPPYLLPRRTLFICLRSIIFHTSVSSMGFFSSTTVNQACIFQFKEQYLIFQYRGGNSLPPSFSWHHRLPPSDGLFYLPCFSVSVTKQQN